MSHETQTQARRLRQSFRESFAVIRYRQGEPLSFSGELDVDLAVMRMLRRIRRRFQRYMIQLGRSCRIADPHAVISSKSASNSESLAYICRQPLQGDIQNICFQFWQTTNPAQ